MRRAVVDVGSNSVLLLVGEQTVFGWESVFESSEVTGLGRGVKRTGMLSEAGMRDTLEALRRAHEESDRLEATEWFALATMAARIASNTPVFLERAHAQGTPVHILSAANEAQLGFDSVAGDPLFAGSSRISIIDPGGNSTELVTAERVAADWQNLFKKSVPIGTLGFRDGVLANESPSAGDRLRATAEIDDLIACEFLPGQAGQAVVLGATGTNLVSIRERLAKWDPTKVHGSVLEYEEVGRAVGWLCDMDDQGRGQLVGIERGREATIHIGALILERFLYALHVDSCKVSVRGWRHALLESGTPRQWLG